MRRAPLVELFLLIALAGCSLHQQASSGAAPAVLPAAVTGPRSKIQHVVIIFQENRSVDNLFHGLPGADTANYGYNSHGQQVQLQPIPLTERYDISHQHSNFLTEYANGALNGFNLAKSNCSRGVQCPPKDVRAYAYVPQNEVQPYFSLAEQYAFADRMFQTNQGPSFPAHQYIVSGTSTISQGSPLRAAENPKTPQGTFTGGCDSPSGSLVALIDPYGRETRQVFPCFERPALSDLLAVKALTWSYYQQRNGAGLWNAFDAIQHIRDGGDYRKHVIEPPEKVINAITGGQLANVVWVTPTLEDSDHPGNNGSGPSWVAWIVNTIGKSPYWNNTAIFITWDDWGGWYEHVKPPQYNSYELGFRVPLIVVSPYAKTAYISHKRHEFGSILKFVEETFNLGSLGTTDVRADDLLDCFDFSRAPRPFKTIQAPLHGDSFLRRPLAQQNPDDDF
ncbi:MAG TPA: alkaline phosphatase family protein [Candidatus Binatia bacterium]|nr:alkaline phosphatase family protein [Candidatus Binatia bacterium]